MVDTDNVELSCVASTMGVCADARSTVLVFDAVNVECLL